MLPQNGIRRSVNEFGLDDRAALGPIEITTKHIRNTEFRRDLIDRFFANRTSGIRGKHRERL